MNNDSPILSSLLSQEDIERFRHQGFYLDQQGQFWHNKQPITHPRLHQACLQWLDCLSDGRIIIRLDSTRYAYVDIEDTPLLITSVQWNHEQAATIYANNNYRGSLAYNTLTLGKNDALYCYIGRLEARITTKAWQTLSINIEPNQHGDLGLYAENKWFPIKKRRTP